MFSSKSFFYLIRAQGLRRSQYLMQVHFCHFFKKFFYSFQPVISFVVDLCLHHRNAYTVENGFAAFENRIYLLA